MPSPVTNAAPAAAQARRHLVAEPGTLAVAELLGMAAPYNPRKITRPEFAALRRSVREFGFVEPAVVNRRGPRVVGGHQRIRAAYEEGYTELPVVWVDLDEAAERQLNLALNKIAGSWDDEKLRQVLADIVTAGADPTLTGFSDEELGALLKRAAKEGLTDDDEAPELQEQAVTVPGEVWSLGAHRLVCGDAREAELLALVMAGHQADLVLTDPPYNVAYEGGSKKRKAIANDAMTGGEFYTLLERAFTGMRGCAKDGAGIYVFHADTEGANFRRALVAAGWKLAQCCVWVKQQPMFCRSDYHWQHEPVLYGWNPTAAHRWYADRKQSTVWEFDRPQRSDLHPTMKPIAMLEYILGNSSRGGDLVLDTFGGSGSTLIACEKTQRMARLVELSPHYCDVIVRRWQEFTGELARDAAGETFFDRQRKSLGT